MTNAELAIDSTRAIPAAHRRTRRAAVAWIVWGIVVGNAVAITWIWLQAGGISSVHTTGDLLTSLGRITGLLGAYLALIQVLLLARIPWLERLAGFDRLTVWHRLNGKICLILILAHVVLITVGYAMMDKISVPSEVSAILSGYPGMITATVGTVLLIVVVVESLVIVRRRLRYETWYLVHLTAYAGIALGWFHQIPTGNELTTNAGASDYWTSLYVATLALLVAFRVVQPVYHGFRHRLRVASVTVESPTVVSLEITGRRLDRLDAQAGQFFLWRFLTRGRWWESHPFSLSRAPDGRSLRITVKSSGDFTRRIGSIEPGTAVSAEGPFGVFTDSVRRRDRVALIAGGIGITPVRSLLEEMHGDLAFVYRVISEDDVIFREELEQLAREREIALTYVVGDHADPAHRELLSPDHLRRLIPDLADREVYLCGPPAMADAIEKNVRRAGVPRRFIHTERFAL